MVSQEKLQKPIKYPIIVTGKSNSFTLLKIVVIAIVSFCVFKLANIVEIQSPARFLIFTLL